MVHSAAVPPQDVFPSRAASVMAVIFRTIPSTGRDVHRQRFTGEASAVFDRTAICIKLSVTVFHISKSSTNARLRLKNKIG